MRTCCANCGMIYDILVSDMDFRTPLEVSQSGVCPRCKSNAHNPIPIESSLTITFNSNLNEIIEALTVTKGGKKRREKLFVTGNAKENIREKNISGKIWQQLNKN